MRSGIVTLLTDFGAKEPYVGVMKGVLLGIHPEARIVDLTHQIAPQRVLEANFALHGAWPYFPPGTVHVVVVDPGVGSSRRILCARARDAIFLAPDNGVLTGVLGPDDEVRAVTNAALFRGGEVSNTFHGRDIFAPVAARLARGLACEEVGPPVDDPATLALPLPARLPNGDLSGIVIHVDAFGNLITNVRREDLDQQAAAQRCVAFRGQPLGGPVASYAAVPIGAPLAIVDSFGYLEIAVNSGNAAAHFNAVVGDAVRVTSG